jgi:hypothetical protein
MHSPGDRCPGGRERRWFQSNRRARNLPQGGDADSLSQRAGRLPGARRGGDH